MTLRSLPQKILPRHAEQPQRNAQRPRQTGKASGCCGKITLSHTESVDPKLTVDQIDVMLRMQQSMNSKVDPDWRQARYPYLRAVVIEGAEAIEHHGWKWWKKQELDLAQLQMELIDIWHFILSEMLLRHDDGSDAGARKPCSQRCLRSQ